METSDEIFLNARQMADAAERAAYLAIACGGDVGLRSGVEEMLRDAGEAEAFFGVEGSVAFGPGSRLTAGPGTVIGSYRLLEKIGEGGMGVVYMAEQREPVKRRVALKIVKLGMDTHQVVARFEAERQALALMDHPNIAKVLEAAATETGRPYFVMELVRGIKITDYCDQNHLSTEERLDLFVKICGAVQHAHQKGIIHRDLKPSNILVADHDGVPMPKIIDFGIAKATTGQPLTDKTVFTEFEQFIGTPAYMSPEQARLSGLDIDTRTDIYALGVLLYELLTGETPFDAGKLLTLGLEEMRRTIREVEPVKPSTRLTEELANAEKRASEQAGESSAPRVDEPSSTHSHPRHDLRELQRLIPALCGDLDWIVMKCLAKDRSRRYATANALATDVQRHLHDEPVLARPPSKLYEFQKSVRRHRFGFAAAAALILVLAAGVVVSMWQAVRATRAEREQGRLRQEAVEASKSEAGLRAQAEADEHRAETEAARSTQVAQLMKGMLEGVGPSVALGRNTDMLREILDGTARRLTDLKAQPAVEADLRATLGNVYQDLGEYNNAAAMHRQALALRQKLLGNEHPEVGKSLNELAQALYGQGKFAEAEALHTEALTLRRKLFPEESLPVAESLNNLAEAMRRQGATRLGAAEPLLREALATRRKLLTTDHLDVASSLYNLGALLWRRRQFTEAESALREGLAIRRKLLAADHPDIAASLDKLGLLLGAAERHAEAEQVHREALAMRRKLLGPEHPDVAHSLQNLGFSLIAQDRLPEAQPLVEEALAIRRKCLRADHPDTIMSMQSLVDLLARQGKLDEAEEPFREESELRNAENGGERFILGRQLIDSGSKLFLNAPTKPAEGQRLVLRGYAIAKRRGEPTSDMDTYALGLALQNQGDLTEAKRFLRQALDFRRSHWEDTNPAVVNPLKSLIDVVQAQGRIAEAEALYLEEQEFRRKHPGEKNAKFTEWLLESAAFLSKQGSMEKAIKLYAEAGEQGSSRALNTLAWIHATSANPKLRDGKLALGYAQRAAAGTNENNPAHLDGLAAACAADGQFDQAVTVLQRAIPLQKDEQVKRGYFYRLKLYQASQPYRSIGSLADAARALLADGNVSDAIALCQEAIAAAEAGEAEKGWAFIDGLVSLAGVFQKHGKLREAEALYREELALQKTISGETHKYVAYSLAQLARVLRDEGKLTEAAKLFGDALTIRQKSLAAGDPALVTSLAELTATLLAGRQFANAEPFARECLAIREKVLPDHWLTFNARVMLGVSLLGQKKYNDAEPLLLSGYEGMDHCKESIPAEERPQLNEALQRLVQLYEAMARPDHAAEWKKKLTAFNTAETERAAAATANAAAK